MDTGRERTHMSQSFLIASPRAQSGGVGTETREVTRGLPETASPMQGASGRVP